MTLRPLSQNIHRRRLICRAVLKTAVAFAVVAAHSGSALAQSAAVSPERATIDQLRATTMALLDALDRQQQQSQQRADAMAQQAIEQQRVTTMALIEVLVGQGLLPRDRAETLMRMAAPAPQPAAAGAGAGASAQAPAGRNAAASGIAVPVPLGPAAAGAVPGAQANAAPGPRWGDPPTLAGAVPGVAGGVAGGAPIRVPYVSETVRGQIREQVRNDVLATIRDENWASPQLLPPWVRGVRLFGDLRVRGQFETYPDDNFPAELFRDQSTSPAWSPDIVNTSIDRTRLTLRARLGVEAKISDDVNLGLRLSTGTTSGPASASQTLGTGFNKASVVLDRASLRWEPWQDFRVLAGRIANPFFGTDLLWADDLGFDGVALQAERTLASGLYAFATAGAFPLEEFNADSRDKWLFGAQLGVDWSLGSSFRVRTALAFYDFHAVEGVRERLPPPSGPLAGTRGYLNSQYPVSLRQKGNTLINLNDPTSVAAPTWGLASSFQPINLTTAFTFQPGPSREAGLSIDWVMNSAFDINDIEARAGVPLADLLRERTTGLQLRGHFGAPQLNQRGDWQVYAAFRQFERDAWIDGFTDTTWNLGGTNYRGWSLGGSYAFDIRTSLGLRMTSTRSLDDGYRSATGEATKSSAPLRIDVLQVDLNSRF